MQIIWNIYIFMWIYEYFIQNRLLLCIVYSFKLIRPVSVNSVNTLRGSMTVRVALPVVVREHITPTVVLISISNHSNTILLITMFRSSAIVTTSLLQRTKVQTSVLRY